MSGLAHWPNDDLLIEREIQQHVEELYPALLPVLHWPEHAELFRVADLEAGAAKRDRRRIGAVALSSGIASLLLTAISPALTGVGVPGTWLGVAAAVAATAGIALGLFYLFGSIRMTWLTRRFRTERLREFYFQFILNNLDLAVAAMSDHSSLEQWRRLRAEQLSIFRRDIYDPVEVSVSKLESDVALQDAWVFPEWKMSRPSNRGAPELRTLLGVLRRQRLGIQQHYAQAKRKPHVGSPHTLAPYVRTAADVAAALTWLLTPIIAVMLAMQLDVLQAPLLWVVVASALLGVVGSALRTIDSSFQLTAEVERTDWYLASLEALAAGFETSTAAEQVLRLRQLEELSYEELRKFIVGHKSARFIV